MQKIIHLTLECKKSTKMYNFPLNFADFFAGDAGDKYEVWQYRKSAQIFSNLTDLSIVKATMVSIETYVSVSVTTAFRSQNIWKTPLS